MEYLKDWKHPIILLFSIGIANIGDFIYLVAINIIVYQLTGSAAAVAGLWIIGPLTNIVTKFWTGSFIDYRSKRRVMIKSDEHLSADSKFCSSCVYSGHWINGWYCFITTYHCYPFACHDGLIICFFLCSIEA